MAHVQFTVVLYCRLGELRAAAASSPPARPPMPATGGSCGRRESREGGEEGPSLLSATHSPLDPTLTHLVLRISSEIPRRWATPAPHLFG